VKSSDRQRLEALRAQQDTAERLRREAEREAHRFWLQSATAYLAGTATAQQYSETAAYLVPRVIKPWRSTLTMGKARRELGLGVGYRHDASWFSFVVGDVLSYAPGERLAAADREGLERLETTWRDPNADPDLRLQCAAARRAIGPGSGEERRADLWRTARKRARRKLCYPLVWPNQGLLSVWEELDAALVERSLEPPPEDRHCVVPYEAFEYLLRELYGGGGSAQHNGAAAGSGQ